MPGIDGFDTCGVPTVAGHLALQLSASADFGKSGSGERRGTDGTSEHIYAIIGPETDEESELVTQITNVYQLPIMGFSADSGVLSNSYSYPNYLRVIPPAQMQATTMVEMMFREGWRYMHVLYSDNIFGLYGSGTVQSVGMSVSLMEMCINKNWARTVRSQVQTLGVKLHFACLSLSLHLLPQEV